MNNDVSDFAGDGTLRHKAEKQYRRSHSQKNSSRSEADTLKLVHELEVHQIELEMQYEDLKQAEAKAEIAAEKFTALYDFAPVGYFTLDDNCTICELNLTGARMIGRERSSLVNCSFRQFITHDSLSVFNDFFKKVFKTGSMHTCEVRLRRNENVRLFIHMDGIFSPEDRRGLITLTDITEREQVEQKLKVSETHYRRLFETAKDGILILDAYSGRIVDVNPYLIELLGYSYEEFLGKELWEIGIFKNIDESQAAFIELQNKGYVHFDDLPLETKNGKQIIVEYVSNVYLVDNLKVVQCNIHDITDRKRAEDTLKENERHLRELNATKDKFFSIIAHDLKSPFTAIIGLSEILSEQVLKKDLEGIHEYASIIQKSSWQVMELLTNLIEWSRSQTGRMEFKPKDIELVELIDETIELFNDSASQKSITICKGLPVRINVIADRFMMSTIFRNLISNAIKFTNKGGTINISYVQKVSELMITISDSGVGIKKEAINKLFRIEESISTTGTEGEEGTGLGLLLCKEFVSKHGGSIWVESEPGKGTKFYFTIPKILKA
jgi:PAS domain S-box-containing protein